MCWHLCKPATVPASLSELLPLESAQACLKDDAASIVKVMLLRSKERQRHQQHEGITGGTAGIRLCQCWALATLTLDDREK